MSRVRRRTPSASLTASGARRVRVVLSTAPPRVARRIARELVERGVAACVHVLPAGTSVYRWRGAVERATESVLVVKTSAGGLAACTRALRAAHPYEVPEALVLTPTAGTSDYVGWIVQNSGSERS